MEIYVEIKDVFQDEGSLQEIYVEMKEVFSKNCNSKIRSDHFEVTVEPRSTNPSICTSWLSSTKVIAETLGFPCENVGDIIHNILDTRNFSVKRVPKYLDANHKCVRVTTLKALLNLFAVGKVNFMAHVVIMDEICLRYYGLQTK